MRARVRARNIDKNNNNHNQVTMREEEERGKFGCLLIVVFGFLRKA